MASTSQLNSVTIFQHKNSKNKLTYAAWNYRGLSGPEHHPKKLLLSDLNKDLYILNEQWTTQNVSGYNCETEINKNTRNGKINSRILVKNSLLYSTVNDHDIDNTVFIILRKLKIIVVSVYLRPRSADLNEMIMRHLQAYLNHASARMPDHSILLVGDINRMDGVVNSLIGTLLNKISPK